MRILVACEESQTILKELLALGHDAWSCDIKPCSGQFPEKHITADVLSVLDQGWELMIAHPPCTYLSGAGDNWFWKDGEFNWDRQEKRLDALDFVLALWNAPIDRIAIENPVGAISTMWRKPQQIVQPWMFGDEAQKRTCFWLKNLPRLVPTKIVDKGEFFEWICKKTGKKRRQPKWFFEAWSSATPEERRTIRSKTFPGLAKAIADQWTREEYPPGYGYPTELNFNHEPNHRQIFGQKTT